MKIKTRESLKTIKTFDRAENLADKTKNGISGLNKGAEQTQGMGYTSGTEYAGNQVQGAEETGTKNALYGANRAGRWGVRETSRNIRRWRSRKKPPIFQNQKALPTPKRQRLSAPKTADKTAKNTKTVQKTAKATLKASQKAAQAAKTAAKAAVHGTKVAARATVAAVKATVAAVKGIVAAIAAGGWIAIVVIVALCAVSMAVGAVFGIFTPKKGNIFLNSVIFECENEYAERIEQYKTDIAHDTFEIRGSPSEWKNVLAVYMVKYNLYGEDKDSVTSFNQKQADKLKQIYRDFNSLSATTERRIKTVTHFELNANGEWAEVSEDKEYCHLIISYHFKTTDEITADYKFSIRQQRLLNDLLSPRFDELWSMLLAE